MCRAPPTELTTGRVLHPVTREYELCHVCKAPLECRRAEIERRAPGKGKGKGKGKGPGKGKGKRPAGKGGQGKGKKAKK